MTKDWNKLLDILITIADMIGAILKGTKKLKKYYDKRSKIKKPI